MGISFELLKNIFPQSVQSLQRAKRALLLQFSPSFVEISEVKKIEGLPDMNPAHTHNHIVIAYINWSYRLRMGTSKFKLKARSTLLLTSKTSQEKWNQPLLRSQNSVGSSLQLLPLFFYLVYFWSLRQW